MEEVSERGRRSDSILLILYNLSFQRLRPESEASNFASSSQQACMQSYSSVSYKFPPLVLIY